MKTRIKPMAPGISRAARLRAYLAALVVTSGLVGVAWRAWALQVGDGERYRAIATRQHELTVQIRAPRGDIIDVRGRPLAVTAGADSIWANPREIRDVTDTADKLAALLGGSAPHDGRSPEVQDDRREGRSPEVQDDRRERPHEGRSPEVQDDRRERAALEDKLGGDRKFVWLARHVTPALAREVRAVKLPGIEVGSEPRRWYPERAIGGPVIGRSDIDGKGVDGIELAMNAQLIGQRGEGLALRDARGKRMFADGIERPQAGATVQLSLDITIQAIAEAAIADAVRTNKARSGVVVAIDIATGRVVAMASAPSYDPNGSGPVAAGEASGAKPEPARNRAVTDVYEAGSVMKIFSIAAALDDGTVNPDTEFDLGGGQFVVGNSKAITDVHHDPYLTVAGIIKRSSNVGAAKIALRFGSAKLYAALRQFGFGARTGIELPGEQPGMLRDGARWRDRDLASISFGYGLSVTPVQIAAAVAVFGNHGRYRAPRIVERVVDSDGTVLYQADEPERQVVSERTAATMAAMLVTVFEGGKLNGTASKIVVPGFRCAGKTGTARKYDPETHSYVERYLSTFAGLAPADHPRLAIVALVDEPSEGDYFGGTVAGPVFARLASEALRYLGVPGEPTVCPPAVAGTAPPAPGAVIAPRTCLPAPRPSPPAAGHAAAATIASSTTAAPSDPSIASGDPGSSTSLGESLVPDFRGMGIARAIATARQAHVAISISGTGRVVEQRPPPGGDRAKPGSSGRAAPHVWLRLSDGSARGAAREPER